MESVHIDPAKELDYYVKLPYTTKVFTDSCDGAICYVAVHPELPGCMAQGDSPEEAVRTLRSARQAYLETLQEEGIPIPLPKQLPNQSPTMAESGTTSSARVVLQGLAIGHFSVRPVANTASSVESYEMSGAITAH